eukprot:CAMPEP_0114660744 /NCGR_PEP_ID=MMETSP0191-20121206/20837_1 /TAXON_ID=126664 /ORGANISM="Sorites sp." /LENGTH=101 /DNA_ID=CAMNT_0001890639 /DNA_START=84 /DNA_END=389 /DNA_ORIENTATION=-
MIPDINNGNDNESSPNIPKLKLPHIAPILPNAVNNPNAVDLQNVGDNSDDTTSNAVHAITFIPLNTDNVPTICHPVVRNGTAIKHNALNPMDNPNVVRRSK